MRGRGRAVVIRLVTRVRELDAVDVVRAVANSRAAKNVEFGAWLWAACWAVALLGFRDLYARSPLLGDLLGGPLGQAVLGGIALVAAVVEGVGLWRRNRGLPYSRDVRRWGCLALFFFFGLLSSGYLIADFRRAEGWGFVTQAAFALLAYARLILLDGEDEG
jgi:hypothetical protein